MQHQQTIFMFPGQGCQYYQMGGALYDTYAAFREKIDYYRAIIFAYSGFDLVNDVLLTSRSKADAFNDLTRSQPAIIAVSVALAHLLHTLGYKPDYLIASSLGEISACLFADAYDAETIFALVAEHVALFNEDCKGGVMLSIFTSIEQINALNYAAFEFELVSKGFDGNIVIAGPSEAFFQLETKLRQLDILYEVLPVNIAFHTQFIEHIKPKFIALMQSVLAKSLQYPIFSSAFSREIQEINPEYFWGVIRRPIRFKEGLATLMQPEVSQLFLDVGPSGNLATLGNYAFGGNFTTTFMSALTPFSKTLAIAQPGTIG